MRPQRLAISLQEKSGSSSLLVYRHTVMESHGYIRFFSHTHSLMSVTDSSGGEGGVKEVAEEEFKQNKQFQKKCEHDSTLLSS